jgi:hypothetical protein
MKEFAVLKLTKEELEILKGDPQTLLLKIVDSLLGINAIEISILDVKEVEETRKLSLSAPLLSTMPQHNVLLVLKIFILVHLTCKVCTGPNAAEIRLDIISQFEQKRVRSSSVDLSLETAVFPSSISVDGLMDYLNTEDNSVSTFCGRPPSTLATKPASKLPRPVNFMRKLLRKKSRKKMAPLTQ